MSLTLLAPFAGLAVLLVAARLGRLGWKTDLALVAPPPARAAIVLVAWLAMIAATELARGWLGMPPPPPWKEYPPAIFALRVAAIGVAGPVLEELLVRGVLYERLGRTRVGRAGAVVIGAAAWALIHTGQGWNEAGFTFVDGLAFGAARWYTGSIYVPCLMHAIGNLYSIGQSLGLW